MSKKLDKIHPIKLSNGKHDERYQLSKEFCGYAKPHWVLRFCGDWIISHINYDGIVELAKAFHEERMKNL